jgi:type I restriction enzyme R subunit
MGLFDEATLENAIMGLFEEEGYTHVFGDDVHKDISDVILEDDLRSFLISNYSVQGITPSEVDAIVAKVRSYANMPLYEGNKSFYKIVSDGFDLKRQDPKAKDFHVYLFNYSSPESNLFKTINQLQIKGVDTRIPDGLVYINGLPVVIIEFKTAVEEKVDITNAYSQITVRYRRFIPDLLKYVAFAVISDGVNTKYGSQFAQYDYFYAWRKIEENSKLTEGIDSLHSLIEGAFKKERLLDIIHNFIYFPDQSDKEEKYVCRYPQYFGTKKLIRTIKLAQRPEGDGKGGTYFGATGCGKSLTMLYLSRAIMKDPFFRSPTIVLITDRTDLDKQLAELFIGGKGFIGDECIKKIEDRANLGQELRGRESGGVFLTTIQKFTEDTTLLSTRNNIICISDEAHRTQVNVQSTYRKTDNGLEKHFGFARYLHDSLPNATFVGFTGTPIDATIEVFGKTSDSYTMSEAVADGITVNIVYEGRAAKVVLDSNKIKEIEKYYEKCAQEGANEYQIEESQKAVTKLETIIGDDNRLEALAKDLVDHYESRVFEHATVAGKAMVVCMDRTIAFKLYQKIIAIRPDWAVEKPCADGAVLSEKDKRKLKPMPLINLVITRGQDDPQELFDIAGNDEHREELDRQFKNPKSNFKIAIVVDMWITGFDVPCLDTMYIDKPLQEHTLIQTISRVNRVYPGKEKGLIIDYFGIKSQMNIALKMYNTTDKDVFEGIEQSITIVKNEIDVLDRMFCHFDSSLFFSGTPKEKLETLNSAAEYVQQTKEFETRFMASAKRMKAAYNLCSLSDSFTEKERDSIYFYGAVRSVIFKLTTGEDVPDLTQMNNRVREMISEAIKSDGVEALFSKNKNVKGRETEIFSDEYLERIERIPLKNTKVKILAKLAADAIEEYKKVNRIKGVEFGERLQKLVDSYNKRQEEKIYADQVLDSVAGELAKLIKDLDADKESFKALGVDYEEKAFFDIFEAVAKKYGFYADYVKQYGEKQLVSLSKEIKKVVEEQAQYTDWSKKEDIKAELKVKIILKMADFHYPPATRDDVFKEIFEQAENFKKYQQSSLF